MTDATFDLHLCLVSEYASANLTPLLDPRFRPQEVVLLTSDRLVEETAWLRNVLQPSGLRISELQLADPFDIQEISQQLEQFLQTVGERSIALNASAGNRPMALAAYEVFRHHNRPIFYVQPGEDLLFWLHPYSAEGHDLADRVRLPAFLSAYGTRVTQPGVRQPLHADLRQLTARLIEQVEAWQPLLAALNWLASRTDSALRSPPIPDHLNRDDSFHQLLSLFAENSLLLVEDNRLCFRDDDSRFYANGGWLEEHVYGTLFGLRRKLRIQDLAKGVEVERSTRRGVSRNELDVAFLANNRLYLVECKTKRWSGPDDAVGDGSSALYRLDTLQQLLGGVDGSAILVSYRDVGNAVRRRAEDLEIAICAGRELSSLPHLLQRWVL
ncbi:MAG: DUF1887 family protein [Gammaproteobacteria bacterium]|nr:DUF1887 family protein [Gammaproteobacteria bacterium]